MTTQQLEYLGAKETAAVIRRILRKAFPAAGVSVTTARGSMVSSVDIRWTDGPTEKRVAAMVAGFEAGRFDGMTDSYDYDRTRYIEVEGKRYRPGCKYVFTHREISPRLTLRALEAVVAYRWAWATPAIGERVTAMLERLRTDPTPASINAMYPDAYNIYPGDVQNFRQGRTLSELVRMVAEDRTTLASL